MKLDRKSINLRCESVKQIIRDLYEKQLLTEKWIKQNAWVTTIIEGSQGEEYQCNNILKN